METDRGASLVPIILIVIVFAAGGYFVWKEQSQMKNSEMLDTNMEKLEVATLDALYSPGIKGFYAGPTTQGEYPGVVMVHEWWGLNDNVKDMAKQLAGEGYRVIAVDLHKGVVATTPDEARVLVGAIKQDEATANLKSAVAYLREKGSQKVASLGWCFGGGQSLQLSLSGETLDATIIYYGQLTDDKTKLEKITWPVLGIFGEKDTSISTSSVSNFRDSLTSLGIESEVYVYPNVGHAFANPSGANYAPEETKDAWEKTLAFLKSHLKN